MDILGAIILPVIEYKVEKFYPDLKIEILSIVIIIKIPCKNSPRPDGFTGGILPNMKRT